MSIKDSITDALKEENFRLQQKAQHLENKLTDVEIAGIIKNFIFF